MTDPFGWVLGTAVNGAADILVTMLSGVWQAGLWLLELAFRLVDVFTTPDLSATGPIGYVLPITLWLGGFVAVVMFFVQLGLALVRRDGQSIGRVFLGLAQFAIVWGSFVVIGAGVVVAASGLTRGILSSTLNVEVLASWDGYRSWPREGVDVASAFVLAVTSLLLLIPAAFADVLVALVREAALIVLTAVAPIAAAGLLSDVSRAWFWKSLRWFLSAAFIAPGSALVLGIGVKVSEGVVAGAGAATSTAAGATGQTLSSAAAVGTAVVGAALVAVAAVAPLTLFRLLAFVDPSTVSGAAMRQAWADFSNRGQQNNGQQNSGGAGAGAAAAGDGTGRAQGEATASTAAESRVSSALGMFGRGMQMTTAIANRAVDLSTDILGSAGVGHPGYSMTPADERALRGAGGGTGGGADPDGLIDPANPPAGPPSSLVGGPSGGSPGGASGPSGGPSGGAAGGAESAGGAAGGAGAATVPVVIP